MENVRKYATGGGVPNPSRPVRDEFARDGCGDHKYVDGDAQSESSRGEVGHERERIEHGWGGVAPHDVAEERVGATGGGDEDGGCLVPS